MTKQVAFLELGLMGGAMAANLTRHGCNVKAWNRTGDRYGVEVAASGGTTIVDAIATAVKDAEVVFSCT